MSKVTFKGKTYSLDDHGFLDPPDQWEEGFAEGMARMVGITGGFRLGRSGVGSRGLRPLFTLQTSSRLPISSRT